MALGGLPPFNGFFSKDLIFEAAESAGHHYLSAVTAATSALTFAYSLKLVYKVFLGRRESPVPAPKTPSLMTICLRVLGATCIFSVLGEEPLIRFFNTSGLVYVGNSVTPYGGLHPVPLALSMGALASGLSAFALRKYISEFLTAHSPISKIVEFINGGYGFDRLCNVLSQLTISIAVTLSGKRYFDQSYNAVGWLTSLTAFSLSRRRFVDRFFDTLGRLTVAAASGVRKMQTGVLGWNIAMMIVGVMGVISLAMILS